MNPHRPPRTADLIVAALLRDPARCDALLGDLTEEFDVIASQHGARAARRRYWLEVVRSIVPLAVAAVRGEAMRAPLRLAANVTAGVGAIATIVPLSFFPVAWLTALVKRSEYVDGVLSVAHSSATVYAWWALAGAITAFAAGYLLTRLGGRSGVASALMVGLICVPLSTAALASDNWSAHVWLQLALSALAIPAVTCGALVRVRAELAIGQR